MASNQRMAGRKYRIPHYIANQGSVFVWTAFGWAYSDKSVLGTYSDEYLTKIGYDLSRNELQPLTLDKQLEEILRIDPSKIEFRIDTIVVDYGAGLKLILVCRSLRDGIQRLADELYLKRVQVNA